MATTYTTPNDPRFKEVEETVNWTMQFPSGVQASCASSYGWHQAQYYYVLGSNATIALSPAFPYEGIRMPVNRKSPTNPRMEQKAEQVLGDRQSRTRERTGTSAVRSLSDHKVIPIRSIFGNESCDRKRSQVTFWRDLAAL